MKFVDSLTQPDFQLLYEIRRTSAIQRIRDRSHAVLLSNKGYKINNVANIFDLDRDTVSAWLDAWKVLAEEGLSDKPHTG